MTGRFFLRCIAIFVQACWVFQTFHELKFKKANVLERGLLLCNQCLLHDQELPVKVEAAITLQMMLSEQEKGATADL